MNAQAISHIIHNALTSNIAFLDEATQYLTSYCNMLKIFLKHYNSIPIEVPKIKKKIPMILRVEREHVIDNPEPTLTSSWKKIATGIFCNDPVEQIIESLEKTITVNIAQLKAKYSSDIGLIEQSIHTSVADITNIEQQYNSLYQEYNNLCQAIEKYHSNPSLKEKYDQLKFKFKSTQKAAVDKLAELNHKILNYNLEIERALTKYEEAEKQKFDSFYNCIFDFTETMKKISEMNKKITENVSTEVSTINSQKDVDQLVDEPALQKIPSRIRLSRKGSISGSRSSTEAIIKIGESLKVQDELQKVDPVILEDQLKQANDTQQNEPTQPIQSEYQKDEEQSNDHQVEEIPKINKTEIDQTEATKDEQPLIETKQAEEPQPNEQPSQQNDLLQQENNQQQEAVPTQQNEQPKEDTTAPDQNATSQQDTNQEQEQKQQEENIPVPQNEETTTNTQNEQQTSEAQSPSKNQITSSEQQMPLDSSFNTTSGSIKNTDNSGLTSSFTSTEEQLEVRQRDIPIIPDSNNDNDINIPVDEEIQEELTFFETTKMFTFDVSKYLTPDEIFKDSLKSYNAVLTDDYGSLHKGDEVIVLSGDSHKSVTIMDNEGTKTTVDGSKIQKVFERKIMQVASKVDEGELEVEVGEYVLVINEREGFSKCLSAYREEGIILSSKLTPYVTK